MRTVLTRVVCVWGSQKIVLFALHAERALLICEISVSTIFESMALFFVYIYIYNYFFMRAVLTSVACVRDR